MHITLLQFRARLVSFKTIIEGTSRYTPTDGSNCTYLFCDFKVLFCKVHGLVMIP